MKAALLDTNVLLALAWPNHQHHTAAHRWFVRQARLGWATCAVTQLGFIRLSSNPAFTSSAVSPAAAALLLDELTGHPRHAFWESPPACAKGLYGHALGHQQVNDAWLVAAARHNGGLLATLDGRLRVHDPRGECVMLIPGTT